MSKSSGGVWKGFGGTVSGAPVTVSIVISSPLVILIWAGRLASKYPQWQASALAAR
jgi:hypothetical protein